MMTGSGGLQVVPLAYGGMDVPEHPPPVLVVAISLGAAITDTRGKNASVVSISPPWQDAGADVIKNPCRSNSTVSQLSEIANAIFDQLALASYSSWLATLQSRMAPPLSTLKPANYSRVMSGDRTVLHGTTGHLPRRIPIHF